MNNENLINSNIENIIYEIRGKQVMLDSDLAILYQCKNGTKTINLAVKRHIERFPERFMFRLTEDESKFFWFQLETKKITIEARGGKYNRPYVFTEQGVMMLSTILRTSVAGEVSIKIMDAFVSMKKYISHDLINQRFINDMVISNHKKIELIESLLWVNKQSQKTNEIFYNGQIFDAYSKIYKIFNEANNNLIIIDAYADVSLLDIVKRLNAKVIIITKPNNLLTKQDIDKYNRQYHNLKVVFNNTFHDRYFIIDNVTVYHCGTSINRIGYKTFSINVINDKEVCESLIHKVNKII